MFLSIILPEIFVRCYNNLGKRRKYHIFALKPENVLLCTLWFQLADMFQSIVMPQGIEKVTIQLKDTTTKVYAMCAKLVLSKVPLEVLQN